MNNNKGASECSKHDIFINDMKDLFCNTYDFSKFIYINTKTKGDIFCKKHELWFQKDPEHLYRKQGCPLCSIHKKRTQEQFIKEYGEKFNNEYDLSNINFVNMQTIIHPYCNKHKITFPIKPQKLLKGQGCPKCRYEKTAYKQKSNLSDLIQAANNIHNSKYDYSLIEEYNNVEEKYPIVCPIHGIFYQNFSSHLYLKQGCPKCGSIVERDYNAALNILDEGIMIIGSSTTEFTLVDYPLVDDKVATPLKSNDRLKQENHNERMFNFVQV